MLVSSTNFSGPQSTVARTSAGEDEMKAPTEERAAEL